MPSFRDFFRWAPPEPSGLAEYRKIGAIVAIPFGSHQKGQPIGISNVEIAQKTEDIRNIFHRCPTIVQWEIADAMEGPCFMIGEPYNPHISSWEFFLTIRRNFPGLKKIIIVAHPHHIRRCVWIAEKLGFKALIPDVSGIPYDPDSSQKWCRNKIVFWPWEMLSRVHHLIRWWI